MLLGLLPLLLQPAAPAEEVFVSGSIDPGQPYPTYRIPAICRTSKGTLLAFAEGRQSVSDQALNAIVLRRRPVRSRGWGEIRIVARDDTASLNNPCVLATRGGRVWMMYQRYPKGISERNAQAGYDPDHTCGSFVVYSDDDGLTWVHPTDITRTVRPESIRTVASGPGVGIELAGKVPGRLSFPFNEGVSGSWTVFTVFSDDKGRSWRRGESAPKAAGTQPNEVQIAETSDGTVLLNARNQASEHSRLVGRSADGGVTWSEVQIDRELPDPVCMGSIVSVSSKPDLLAFSNPSSRTGRQNGVLRVSRDGGGTWMVASVIEPGSFAYSCLVPLPHLRVGVLYESVTDLPDGQEGYRILYKEIALGQ